MLPFALTILLLSILAPVRAQQCRLVVPNGNRIQNVTTPSSTTSKPSATSSSSSSTSMTSTTTTSSPTPTFTPFNYGVEPVRGVNLGGWFVLEPWITPSIFENTNNTDIVDEYTFGQYLDAGAALNILQDHWNTWITEDDFQVIAAAGLNHVRIPLGYWSVPITTAETSYSTDVSPFITGAWPYLLQALNWARSYNIHVILDLHGAPGSQNGYDNSGQRTNNPQWATGVNNVNRTLDIIKFIAENVGGMVDILELLNEPAGFESDAFAQTVREYWQSGYTVVRDAIGSNTKVMIEDAFLGVQNWDNFLTPPASVNVMMDTHNYQIFSVPELQRTEAEHISFACSQNATYTTYADNNLWLIIGEWSTAITDCAQWLNGRGIGARWDGSISPGQAALGSCTGWTGDQSTFSQNYTTFLRQYWEVQVDIGESVQGWIYWAWKTESADEWSYSKGLQGGWIPQDPSERLYPNIC